MSKQILAAALAALLSPSSVAAQADMPERISWAIQENGSDHKPGSVQFTLSYRTDRPGRRTSWMNSDSLPLAELNGLTAAQYSSAQGAPVRFRLAREAGSFDCEGIVRRQRGTGDCRFLPDPTFGAALASRGLGPPTTPQLFSLATRDLGLRYVNELQRQGYARASIDDLVRAADHGVDFDYLRNMGELGYRARTLAALIEMRDHGVDPDYVRELVASGLKDLPSETLVSMRDHGVSPAYIAELRRAGYSNLPVSDLIRLRDHGVSVAYVHELRRIGYRDVTPDDLVRLRDNGVSADFIRRTSNGGRLSVDELVRRRNGG